MGKRLTILGGSLIVGILSVWGLTNLAWNPTAAYVTYAILAVFFLGMLISNQQYEEDAFSKAERTVSAFLLSYIVFFRLLYAPLSQLFFGTLITQVSFLADLLSLILFMIFFFLFGTALLVNSSYARMGLLTGWRIFNNATAFFTLRILLVMAVGIVLMLYLRNSFFSIRNSSVMNEVFAPSTCNWTYIEYPNFLKLGRTVVGRDVCLYNYAQDKFDPKYCDLISDGDVKVICRDYFLSESEK